MTHGESLRKGHAGGYAIRLDWSNEGNELFLSDYRRVDHRGRKHLTTPYPAQAERFEYRHEAKEIAARMAHANGQRWVVCTIPADAKPRRTTDAQHAYPVLTPCPDCGSDRTAKVGETLRCFRCGNAWRAYEPEDDGLTPAETAMCFEEACATLDDELEGVTP